MPNVNYLKGRRLEWRVRDEYEEMGYLVHRSAGSKSPIDLICFPSEGSANVIKLVQCKHSIPTTQEIQGLAKAGKERGEWVALAWVEGGELQIVESTYAYLESEMREVRSVLKLQKREDRRGRKRKANRSIRGRSTGSGGRQSIKAIRRPVRKKAKINAIRPGDSGLSTNKRRPLPPPGEQKPTPEGSQGLRFASEQGNNYWQAEADRCFGKDGPSRPDRA